MLIASPNIKIAFFASTITLIQNISNNKTLSYRKLHDPDTTIGLNLLLCRTNFQQFFCPGTNLRIMPGFSRSGA